MTPSQIIQALRDKGITITELPKTHGLTKRPCATGILKKASHMAEILRT